MARTGRALPVIPLFLVAGAAVGFEVALARYFALASWSEYGYWVISIAMAGFAVSGVVLSLFRDSFARRGAWLLAAMPALLIALAALGFIAVSRIPFNPLELQNPQLLGAQLVNIAGFYAALFPFFFVTGLYVGLCFVTHPTAIPTLYGADLLGAGLGALYVLAAMYFLHPFELVLALLPLIALAAMLTGTHWMARLGHAAVGLALLAGAALTVQAFNRADYSPYKSIYPPLHVPDSKIVEEIRSPRGHYLVLDNFTERLDTDFSNNFASLGASAPPATLGLYLDGNRLGSLPAQGAIDLGYLDAALDTLPYRLRPGSWALLIGTRGGFRLAEARQLGARVIVALEPDPVIRSLVSRLPDVSVEATPPRVALRQSFGRYDVIDVASDFLAQGDANKYVFTLKGVQTALQALSSQGILSLPMSIREFTVYAAKAVETARQALIEMGVADPQRHIIVYRSAWNARILVARRPFTPQDVTALREFADRRSFDLPAYPGRDPGTERVWNELPVMWFADATAPTKDALGDDIARLLGPDGGSFRRGHFFNLEPATDDRPFVHATLRLGEVETIVRHLNAVPREELGLLINLAVLAQAIVFAIIVLTLPLLRWRRRLPPASVVTRAVLYFAGLGLGYLLFQMWLIEKAALLLGDRIAAFAVVLAGMLVFSGVGSLAADRFGVSPNRAVRVACLVVLLWTAVAVAGAQPMLDVVLALPLPAKVVVTLLCAAPVAIALGMPFPLGLGAFDGDRAAFLPWAWALNGAFSVVATPLANLLALSQGLGVLLLAAAALYVMVWLTFPIRERWN
ncbi:MAG TPA: hypothetical protein VEC14_13900 [Reyranellaceae bacterium]|nr:hypothetical protein [Reyranellaceae bacterium]